VTAARGPRAWLVAGVAVAVAITMAAHGGFFASGQTAFACLAFAALLAAYAVDPVAVSSASRRAPVLILVALAVLTAASAGWTSGSVADALRWAAVVAAYAALAVAAASCPRSPLAAAILGLATLAGLVGLVGASLRVEPLAERVGGSWPPGGPLEYAPALALLAVSALPIAMRAAVRLDPRRASPPAFALAVAAAVIGLSGSLVQQLLGISVIAVAVAAPRVTIGSDRRTALVLGGFALTVGWSADAIAGSYADPYVTSGGAMRLLGLAALLAAATLWWRGLRSILGASSPLLLGAVLVPLVIAGAAAALTPDTGTAVEPEASATHGRVELWGAAVRTAADGPLLGSGAGTFLEATRAEQEGTPVAVAHDLPLELAVELGPLGMLVGLTLIGSCVQALWRARFAPAGWLFGPAVAAFLVANLVDWSWHIPASAAIFALALGGLLAAADG